MEVFGTFLAVRALDWQHGTEADSLLPRGTDSGFTRVVVCARNLASLTGSELALSVQAKHFGESALALYCLAFRLRAFAIQVLCAFVLLVRSIT